MSNQCSNLCYHRSFSFYSPFLKPYSTTLRPFFPFHRNLILSGRRSRSRSSSLHLTVVAQSSSDIVLIATTEHPDGSLVFRFGDTSEVVENDNVVEEIESQIEEESSVVKVLDGDQDAQVIKKAAGRGYDSIEGGLIDEVAGGIRNVYIDSDIAERETNAIRYLRDYHAESSDRLSDLPEKKVLISQSDAKMSDSLTAVESKFDETKFNVQLDEEDSSDPTINLFDNIRNDEKSADSEGTPLKGSDEKTSDPSVSVELEIKLVSLIEDDLSQVETEGTRKCDTEEVTPSSFPPSVPSEAQLLGAVNKVGEEGLKDMDINEAIVIDDMPSSNQLVVEPTSDEVNQLQSVHLEDQTMEDKLPQVSTENREENNLVYLMPVSCIEEEDRNVKEEVIQPQSTTPLELKPTIQVLNIDLQDTTGQNLDDEILDVDNEIKDNSVSVKFETIQVLDDEVMNVTQSYTKDESHMAESKYTSEGYTTDLLSPAIMHASDVYMGEATLIDEMPTSESLGGEPNFDVSTSKCMDAKNVGMDVKNVVLDERLQDMSISEATFIDEVLTPDPFGAEPEPTLEGSTTGDMDVKDLAIEEELQLMSNDNMDENEIADVMPAELVPEEGVSQPLLTPVELNSTTEVSGIKVQDVTHQNLDDENFKVIDKDAGDNYIEGVEQLSQQLESQHVQEEGVKQLEQCAEVEVVGRSILKQGAHDPLLEAEITEGVLGSSELTDASEVSALLLAAEVEREDIYLTDDFLLSGAALLEHPSKALTGGEDAYFVAGSKWLGVANGVSQWSFEGTDLGVYAQELMKTCEEIVLDTSSVPVTNPVELLCRVVKETTMSGSANVLIASFSGQALHVANIGDTGFLVIRHGAIYKKSSPLLHEFHFALQVEDSDDPLQLVEEHVIELEMGDVVVSATDGLFDNLYEREITVIVSKSLQAGMKPQEIANILATRAQEVGKSAFVRSPFSDAAQAAGYTGYAGGKPDNVAVIVSLVGKGSNLLAA